MPTGYTSQIAEGQKFRDFVLGCARAFGACITLRDDPLGTPIPEEFKPFKYYEERVENAKAELARVSAMSSEDFARALNDEAARARANNAVRREQHDTTLARLEAMRLAVVRWKPPTDEHEHLKTFMLEQIAQTIQFDCGGGPYQEPEWNMTVLEYENHRRMAAILGLEGAKKDLEEEQELCRKRTAWVKALRESLAKEES